VALVKKPASRWKPGIRHFLGRLLGRVKLILFLLPVLSFWLPVRPGVSLLLIFACVLAFLSSLQRSPWLREARWRVARPDWRRPT